MIVRVILESKVRDSSVYTIIDEYKKRLTPYFDIDFLEFGSGVKGYEKLLAGFRHDDLIIGLDISGKRFDSLKFAEYFGEAKDGKRSVNFIIGESSGLSSLARRYINSYLSLSDMTLSFKISLLMLTEQIYRATMIINNHPYHK